MIYYFVFNKTLITFLKNKNITTKIARRCMHVAIKATKCPLCDKTWF